MTSAEPTAVRKVTLRAVAALTATVTVATAAVLFPTPMPAAAGTLPTTTRLVSRTNAGAASPGAATDGSAISGNGRFVAFITGAVMSSADTNAKKDVYVRDLWSGTTELVSLTDADQPVAGDSTQTSISDDGRMVLFVTKAANLIPGDDAGFSDVFLRDRYEGTTRRISIGIADTLLDNNAYNATISGDGTITAFSSQATNVVANDTNGDIDVFTRENFGSNIDRVSVSSFEGQGTGTSDNASISDDGRYVAFGSASLLAGGFPGGAFNVYVRDRTAGTTELVNVKSDETLGDAGGGGAELSGSGRYVAFSSDATNLVSGDTNGQRDVFVRDRTAGTTVRVSLSDADAQLPTGAGSTAISDVGPTVVFFTNDQATSSPDAAGEFDVYARDVPAGTTRRITTGPSLVDPPLLRLTGSIDDSGKSVAFTHPLKLTAEQTFDQVYVNGPVELGPFLSSDQLIDQQYNDFLGRDATDSERNTWAVRFASGEVQPPALIAALAGSDTWAAKRAPLIRLYWAFFLRRPDSGGLTYWLGKYQQGSSLTAIAQSFAKSSEFKNRYGTVTNQQYVSLVYQNVFKRAPDSGGLAYWTNRLNAKSITRGAVIVQFSESSEGKRRLAGPTNITLISRGMHKAVPTAAQWNAVYDHISFGEKQAAYIAGTFLTGSAYTGQFL